MFSSTDYIAVATYIGGSHKHTFKQMNNVLRSYGKSPAPGNKFYHSTSEDRFIFKIFFLPIKKSLKEQIKVDFPGKVEVWAKEISKIREYKTLCVWTHLRPSYMVRQSGPH